MTAEVFLDSNILIYAAMGSGAERPKRERSLDLIRTTNFGISAQVLQEFYVTVVKKAARPLKPAEAMEWIEQLAVFPCQAIDERLVRVAIELSVRYRISYWDAAILAAAEALGASKVYSEDLAHGQWYGSLRIWNPFRGEPE